MMIKYGWEFKKKNDGMRNSRDENIISDGKSRKERKKNTFRIIYVKNIFPIDGNVSTLYSTNICSVLLVFLLVPSFIDG